MSLRDSLLNRSKAFNLPFNHWEISNPLTKDMIKELQNVSISEAPRSFDGTRAAD